MITGQQCGICGNDYDPMHQCGCWAVSEAPPPPAVMLHEREAARDIVSALKAGLMVLSEKSLAPGMLYSISMIEAAYCLKTPEHPVDMRYLDAVD
jgi:hypothetical protein